MMRYTTMEMFLRILLSLYLLGDADAVCQIPDHFTGDYYSIDVGEELNTLITNYTLSNEVQNAVCDSYTVINGSTDGQGRFDAKMIFHNQLTNCYQCWVLYHRTVNILQYVHSTCITISDSQSASVDDICSQIPPNADILTMFRKTVRTVNCKGSIEGTYQFSYEVDYGGGGICDTSGNMVVACQEPGSVYVDNQVFDMYFGECPEVTTSFSAKVKFMCMGSWRDQYDNVYIAVADIGRDVYRERFRCLLTRYDQQTPDNHLRYTMSRWASCASLKSPYDGPIRLVLTPALWGVQVIEPKCNFPRNFSGVWTKGGEYDSIITINSTHIHFQTTMGQFWYRETIFTCQQTRDERYMTTAVNVGRCEVDYVCWDFMPRHHNILRWRLGRSFPMRDMMNRPDHAEYAFRRACSWSTFTLDSANPDWMYSTFILNPPAPIVCPVGGRYTFTQYGRPEELYVTRIRGITERPRHLIDCNEYVSVIQSCDDNPKKITIDAEYCATLDHTGKPIGEYDMPDREMVCVGYWMEDMKSYLITYDLEDPISPFRCWVYERLDWRHVVMSKTSTPWCGTMQTAWTYDPLEFGAVHLDMRESERLFDHCSQRYDTGANPYETVLKVYVMDTAPSWRHSASSRSALLLTCVTIALLIGVRSSSSLPTVFRTV